MENTNQIDMVKSIAKEYSPKTADQNKLDKLTALDGKVHRPADIFAYTFGCAGSLVLGVGMCLAMGVIGSSLSWAFPAGIVIGVVGIALVSVNYFIYKAILKRRKAKYAKEILALSNELLNK